MYKRQHLGIDHEDVLKAWTYWERMGVVRKIRNNPDDKFDYDIEFISLKEQLYGEKTKAKSITVESNVNSLMSDKEIDVYKRQSERSDKSYKEGENSCASALYS